MSVDRIAVAGFREPHTDQKLIPVRFADLSGGGAGEWAARVLSWRRGGK